jgi:hypothetical protein
MGNLKIFDGRSRSIGGEEKGEEGEIIKKWLYFWR